MIIAIRYYVRITATNVDFSFVFNTLLQAKQFLSHYNATVSGDVKIRIFKSTFSIDNSGNISISQTQITSW